MAEIYSLVTRCHLAVQNNNRWIAKIKTILNKRTDDDPIVETETLRMMIYRLEQANDLIGDLYKEIENRDIIINQLQGK